MKYVLVPLVILFVMSITSTAEAESVMLFDEPLFAHDSYSHFLSSVFVYCWQYESLKNAAHMKSGTSRTWAISLTTLFGIFKEIFDDKVQGQHFSYKDIVCNVAGSLMMYVLWK